MALPERDEEYLRDKGYNWRLLVGPGEQLLILHDYPLPADKYTPSTVDLLIRIPAGYPAHNPDMFFVAQPVQRRGGGQPLNVSPAMINNAPWYQWSRHYPAGAWRPGVDGLESYLRAVRTELEKGL